MAVEFVREYLPPSRNRVTRCNPQTPWGMDTQTPLPQFPLLIFNLEYCFRALETLPHYHPLPYRVLG
ncbi:hypothetical protein L873DRAFT_1817683 [Choiromyces venosus 120613-1]|uniref:Uncharacterized protein n=1 Tax=Choiromyces venosus 120613-1 TaxID=1336337 RepID=A0A3N4J207_9PEZI|nr:hypothetical protein L873DRAFT_1817683 [Choiromyces venosus 120613-1]